MNIAEWVKGHALYSPDKVALRTQDGILTYAQFESQIEPIACVLKWQLGVEPGDRVAFLSVNSAEFCLHYSPVRVLVPYLCLSILV